jgi:hypothetical protein
MSQFSSIIFGAFRGKKGKAHGNVGIPGIPAVWFV